jgi:hypothetical protein
MSNIQHIARTGSLIADTLSWPPGSSICNDNESPPRGTVRVRRGGKAKIKPVNLIGRAEFFSGGTSNSECCPSDTRGGRLLALDTRQADFPLTQRAVSLTSSPPSTDWHTLERRPPSNRWPPGSCARTSTATWPHGTRSASSASRPGLQETHNGS